MPILTAEERLGTMVAGRYRLECIRGRGSNGIVYEATHTWTGRRVAVKLLKPEYSRDLGLVRRFLQEARTAARIEHANVVQVLDMGSDADGTVYLVLELLTGESLGARLSRDVRMPPQELLEILLPIMDGVAAAHDSGVIHRDLKPDNIFLHRPKGGDPSGGPVVPKVLDFGVAKVTESAWGHATQTGTLVGTPYYMSPEQAEGKSDLGRPADVWSMGVILYRCLSGKLPFTGDSPTSLLLSIVQTRPQSLRLAAPDVPEELAMIVDHTLNPDPQRRYADMAELAVELRRVGRSLGIEEAVPTAVVEPLPPFEPGPAMPSTPPVAVPRKAPWMFAATIAVITLVGVGALVVAQFQGAWSDRASQADADDRSDQGTFTKAVPATDDSSAAVSPVRPAADSTNAAPSVVSERGTGRSTTSADERSMSSQASSSSSSDRSGHDGMSGQPGGATPTSGRLSAELGDAIATAPGPRDAAPRRGAGSIAVVSPAATVDDEQDGTMRLPQINREW